MPRPTPPTPTRTPRATASRPSRPRPPTPVPTAVGSALPQVSIPPWDGKERLNILLIGADQRPKQGFFNTDTLIVVSIDPVSKQVAMFSLPRDTVDVPIPPGPARNVFGSSYSGKINSWFSTIRNRSDLYPGTNTHARLQRPEGHPRRPLRPRHQVLRRGQLPGLHEGRRRARRRDRQRPGPGLGRPLPRHRRPARAGLHPERHPAHGRRCRRSATRARATRRTTSTAASASSGSCSRSASRPTRRS